MHLPLVLFAIFIIVATLDFATGMWVLVSCVIFLVMYVIARIQNKRTDERKH